MVATEEGFKGSSEVPPVPQGGTLCEVIAQHLDSLTFSLALSQYERQVICQRCASAELTRAGESF